MGSPCGDFKMTVNQASKLDLYPIPKIEDLFAGSKLFTKCDISQAYQRILLELGGRNIEVKWYVYVVAQGSTVWCVGVAWCSKEMCCLT